MRPDLVEQLVTLLRTMVHEALDAAAEALKARVTRWSEDLLDWLSCLKVSLSTP